MDLLQGIRLLFAAEALNRRIKLSVRVDPESLIVTADKQVD